MGDAALAMRGWPGRASLTTFRAGIFVLGMLSISCLELGLQRNSQVISFTLRVVVRKKRKMRNKEVG